MSSATRAEIDAVILTDSITTDTSFSHRAMNLGRIFTIARWPFLAHQTHVFTMVTFCVTIG